MVNPYLYRVAGLDFVSEIELFGTLALEEIGNSPVRIRFGDAPQSLPTVLARGAAFEANSAEALVKVPNVARYWIRGGQEVIVDPASEASLEDIRAFLVCSPFGALLHQRGLVPLHASSVRVGDTCVAIVGPSRAGKSTLSAMLNSRGFPLVTDDVLAIKQTRHGPMAYPGFCRLRLWKDTADALGVDSSGLPRVRKTLNKFELHVVNRHYGEELPLRRIYLLSECRATEQEGIRAVSKAESLSIVTNNTYRFNFIRNSPGQLAHFQQCASMIKDVTVAKVLRPESLSRAGEVVDWLQRDWDVSSQTKQRVA